MPDVQQRLLDQGVRPFSVQVLQGDDIVNKLVYAAIGVAYQDKPEAILPRLLPRRSGDAGIPPHQPHRQVAPRHPAGGGVGGAARPASPAGNTCGSSMRKWAAHCPRPRTRTPCWNACCRANRYEVRRLESLADGVPPEAQTVAVLHPRRLPAEDQLLLRKALHAGKSVFLAVQQYRWNYTLGRQDVSITQEPQHPEVNDWLQQYGIAVDPDVLMDVNHQAMTVHDTDTLVDALVGSGVTLDLPLHMTIPQQAMNGSVSITSRLAPLFYLWGSALSLQPEVLRDHGLDATVLFATSPRAWRIPGGAELTADNLEPPAAGQQYPLAVLVEGRFPPVNGSPAPDGSPGKLIVVGNAQMFHRQLSYRRQRRLVPQQHRRPHPRRGPHPRSRQEADRPRHQPTHARGPALLEIRHRGGHQPARRHDRGHGRPLSPPATSGTGSRRTCSSGRKSEIVERRRQGLKGVTAAIRQTPRGSHRLPRFSQLTARTFSLQAVGRISEA